MFRNFTRCILSACILLMSVSFAKANDSDVVNCGRPYKIVVLGSSTAYGTGATPSDSSWVSKFTLYAHRKNAQTIVYNFGIPGFSSYEALLPSGVTPPTDRPAGVDGFNITAALAEHPDAIIINLPSNDASRNYTVEEQQTNYERAVALAAAQNIPVWVTTTQPRNNMTASQTANLTQMRNWITSRYGVKSVDFWTTLANADGTINAVYNFDGTHVNNGGHDIFYKRIKAETIFDSLCYRYNDILIARAGNDTSIVLPGTGLNLNGAASNGPDPITSYAWTQVSGPAGTLISNPSSAITTLTGVAEGRYSFELKVTDSTGATSVDTVNVIVSSRILIDIGATETTSPDANNNYWNNMPTAIPGIQVDNAFTTTNAATNIDLVVVNRIDGTFNVDGPGTNTGNTIGDVGDYPNSATTDFAFAETSTTSGSWTFTGLEALKQYTFKFWGTRSVSDNRVIQIKRADQSVWQEYNATNNSDYATAAVFTFAGKTSMSFDIRVKDGSAFGHISVVDITRTTALDLPNLAPVANAGQDISVTVPANSATLDGTASTDEDGSIVSYQWTKLTGPSGSGITNSSSAIASATNLAEGIYTFELKVTDNEGAFSTDIVTVTVGLRVLFDFGSTLTTGADAGGKYWNNVATAQTGVTVQNAVSTSNTATTIGFEVVNRIDGTFNLEGPGTNTGNTIGDVGDYPNSATTDFAFAETSTTSGSWKITGLDAQKEYSIKFWGTRSVSDDRFIQIKRSEETAWQEYNATNNSDYNTAATFTFTGKTEQVFNIRVKEGSAFGHISVIDLRATVPACVPVTPSATIAATPAGAICAGASVTFTATAQNGGTAPAWQWTKNGVVIDGANGNTYTSNTLQNNDAIRAVLTSNVACATTPSATSNAVTTTVKQPSSSTTTVAACNNYLWNSVNYVASGVYVKNGLINKAGCDSTATLVLTVNILPSVPAVITGPVNACAYVVSASAPNGVSATYSIRKVTGAASYNWSVPSTAVITSRPGIAGTANDTVIVVRFNTNFVSGNISVSTQSPCGTSAVRTLAITKTIPATPGVIAGVTNACANIISGALATYTITKVSGASDYDWTISGTGATIIEHPAGEGVNDTIITVRFTTAFSNGTLSVRSVSNCGTNATARTLAITKTAPAAPAIQGSASACGGATYTYTATTTGAASYSWTIPLGASFVGANNGATVTIKYPSLFLLGTITAKAISTCGNSGTTSLLVTRCLNLFAKTSNTGNTNAIVQEEQKTENLRVTTTDKKTETVDQKASVNVYPNPSDGNFTISVKGNLKAQPVTVEILNNYGQTIYKTTSADANIQVRIANKLTNGIYFVRSNVNGQIITQKLIVNK